MPYSTETSEVLAKRDGLQSETMENTPIQEPQDEPLTESLTEEMLGELLNAPNIYRYLGKHELDAPNLAQYLNEQLQERGLKLADVLRAADIEYTFGWYAFIVLAYLVMVLLGRLPIN